MYKGKYHVVDMCSLRLVVGLLYINLIRALCRHRFVSDRSLTHIYMYLQQYILDSLCICEALPHISAYQEQGTGHTAHGTRPSVILCIDFIYIMGLKPRDAWIYKIARSNWLFLYIQRVQRAHTVLCVLHARNAKAFVSMAKNSETFSCCILLSLHLVGRLR